MPPGRPPSLASLSLAALAERLGCALPASADPQRAVTRIASLADADGDSVVGCFSQVVAEQAAVTGAAAAITCPGAPPTPPQVVRLELADENGARVAFADVIRALHGHRPWAPVPPAGNNSEDPTSYVAPGADVAPGVTLMPFAYVGPGAEVAAGCVLGVGARVMDGARLGRGCTLQAGAYVGPGCWLGDSVELGPNAVVGGEGFGYLETHSVPHAGRVVLQDRVSLGAGACVDRAVVGETVVGHDTKLDNLVHVAHGVRIGPRCHVAAQSGIAGSARIGADVEIGGQVGIADHARIGNRVHIAARSGVRAVDVPDGTVLAGYPAVPIGEWRRTFATLRILGRLRKQVAALWSQRARSGGYEEKVDD